MEEGNSMQVEFLYKAIDDNQRTIQLTDTKAAAVLVLVGIITAFLATVSKDFLKNLKQVYVLSSENCPYLILHIVLIAILLMASLSLAVAVVLAFKTISPKAGPVESVINDHSTSLPSLFFLTGINPKVGLCNAFRDQAGYFKHQFRTSQLLSQISDLNEHKIKAVLTYELQKVSFIRDLKLERIKWSIRFLQRSILLYVSASIITVLQYLYF